ncbi:MAG: hypothetical protein COB78_09370 [Hyphomicrobiales bacterium]|nr:MAG: hypothetical protein COB78_09370 [Hyphomicrobiales bacterium]
MRIRFPLLLPLFVGTSIFISGCATKPENIKASYVSPLAYESYECDQLSAEAERVSSHAADVTGVQRKKAKGDAVATGVALILFWPAVFFIKGNNATESEVARLKGEMEAIERVAIQKRCSIRFAQG